ncbi:MAG: hypothetical protein ACP5QN_00060 [Minisyncoccia bacterium]
MVKDLLRDIFSKTSFNEKCMSVFLLLLIVMTLISWGMLIFTIIASMGIFPTKTVVTVVEAKKVIPAYNTSVMVGKIIIPQHQPGYYQIRTKIENEEIDIPVEKDFFDKINVGEKIKVDYGLKIFNSYQLIKITQLTRTN